MDNVVRINRNLFSLKPTQKGVEIENMLYLQSVEDIPIFLIADGTIIPEDSKRILIRSSEGGVGREFPVFVRWNKMNISPNTRKKYGEYEAYPADDAEYFTRIDDGRCYLI